MKTCATPGNQLASIERGGVLELGKTERPLDLTGYLQTDSA
jgi:hypothetical protein